MLLLLLLLLLHHPKGPNDGEEVMLSGGNEADICDSLSGFISTQWTRGSLSARYMFDIPDVTRHVMKRDDYYYLPSVVSCVKPTQRILSQPLEQHLCGISFVEYSLTLDTVVDASCCNGTRELYNISSQHLRLVSLLQYRCSSTRGQHGPGNSAPIQRPPCVHQVIRCHCKLNLHFTSNLQRI